MELNLNNKNVLITGGSRGLGKDICLAFAKEGANIAFTYNSNRNKSEQLAVLLQKEYHVNTKFFQCDVSSEKDVRQLFSQITASFGGIDILVNNAGVCSVNMIKDMSLEEWSSVINTNLTGVFLTCREMINHLLSQSRGGRIINIASQAAYNGSKRGKSHYSASKGGIISFTNSLAKEVARHEIFVNAVAPGMLYTEMTADILDEELERYNNQIPIGRIAQPCEVANMILYLSSEKCSYTTGATFDISGGMIGR